MPGGWSVVELAPCLVLEQRWSDSLLRRAVVPFGPALIGWFLLAVTRDSGFGIKLLAQPLAILMLLVAVLGALNFVRSFRRWREGVRLAIDASSVIGYPEARMWLSDYFVGLREHPRSSVKGATLCVYRDTRRGASARARLRIDLQNGSALVGPEASGPDAEWLEVRDALLPAAAAIARALGTKLNLDYPWCEEKVVVSW